MSGRRERKTAAFTVAAFIGLAAGLTMQLAVFGPAPGGRPIWVWMICIAVGITVGAVANSVIGWALDRRGRRNDT